MTNLTFFIGNVQSMGIVKPLLEQAKDAQLITSNPRVFHAYKEQCPTQTILLYRPIFGRLSKAYRIMEKTDAFILDLTDQTLIARFNAPKVHIFHGTCRDVGESAAAQLAKFDLLLTNGPRQTLMLERFHDHYPSLNIKTIGYIPFDAFLEKTASNLKNIKKKFGLDPSKQTITYLPARRACGSWLTHAVKLAKETPVKYNLIMRPHPNQLNRNTVEEQQIVHQLGECFANTPHHQLDRGQFDYLELLCITDLLISDATSPTEEALFYDIPQIVTETYPREQWLQNYQQDNIHQDDIKHLMSLFEVGPSYAKEGFTSWTECIATAIKTSGQYQKARQNYFQHAFGRSQGNAIGNALREIQNIAT